MRSLLIGTGWILLVAALIANALRANRRLRVSRMEAEREHARYTGFLEFLDRFQRAIVPGARKP